MNIVTIESKEIRLNSGMNEAAFGKTNYESIVTEQGLIAECNYVNFEKNEYNMGGIMNPFRLAIVGEGKGPHMFDITEAIGKEETTTRLRRAIDVIK